MSLLLVSEPRGFSQKSPPRKAITGGSPTATRADQRQGTLADKIQENRSTVVRVSVLLEDRPAQIPEPLNKSCAWSGAECIVGTGFFVNESGSVITAAHVAAGVGELLTLAAKTGVSARAEVGVEIPNVDGDQIGNIDRGLIVGNYVEHPTRLRVRDDLHDLAILDTPAKPRKQPWTQKPRATLAASLTAPGSVATLASERPQDGDSIFACGYPMASSALISTSGIIASAWAYKELAWPAKLGNMEKVEVIELNVAINGGNSGGPIFRSSDGAVIGVVVQVAASRVSSGGLATVVPTKYVIELLKKNNLPWSSAPRTIERRSAP